MLTFIVPEIANIFRRLKSRRDASLLTHTCIRVPGAVSGHYTLSAKVLTRVQRHLVQVTPSSAGGRLATWLFGKEWVSISNCHVTVATSVVEMREAVSFVLETRNCVDELIYDKVRFWGSFCTDGFRVPCLLH